MAVRIQNYLEEKVIWHKGTDPQYPYVGKYDQEECLIRLNDFPDEPLYTLIVNGAEVASFDDWPNQWERP